MLLFDVDLRGLDLRDRMFRLDVVVEGELIYADAVAVTSVAACWPRPYLIHVDYSCFKCAEAHQRTQKQNRVIHSLLCLSLNSELSSTGSKSCWKKTGVWVHSTLLGLASTLFSLVRSVILLIHELAHVKSP